MKNFTYYRPSSADQAVGLLADRWGKIRMEEDAALLGEEGSELKMLGIL